MSIPNDSYILQGGCLCGSVKLTVALGEAQFGACHCEQCRRWAGGPFFEVECGTEVTIEGEDHVSTYPSSNWAERGFCRTCGTHLFIRILPDNAAGLPAGYGVPPGLFYGGIDFDFHLQVFTDDKPAYYTFANDTTQITGEEVRQLYPALLDQD